MRGSFGFWCVVITCALFILLGCARPERGAPPVSVPIIHFGSIPF